ncbi:hypothetical protein PVAP13_7KG074218 [Panicum virgatum]|uniref:Uncharacterized protein n=1 Tax=Panicum virgatum TaxID=38727 RepID=A0A8T0QC37_PANVG|nr:hypothetical protein PVAP13_7KG074218 [Panicum virgatum]
MELVRQGVSRFFPIHADNGGVKLLFLFLSIGVVSGEDHRRMGLVQAGFSGGVFEGANSGGIAVRLVFLVTFCERWEGLCTTRCLVLAGGGVSSSGLFLRWPGPSGSGGIPLLDLDVGAVKIRSA